MAEPQPGQLQPLPEPAAEFILALSNGGGWLLVLGVIAGIAASIVWWRRR